jgi:arabinogalactan endo-1,4-beta-galactosidase
MKMSEEFPSKYLKAADLQGREVRVTMAHVEREKIGEDSKPVLYFKGKDKGVVLNKTNAGTISDAYGDDTDDWYDQPLILFSVMVDFQGKVAPAIRCRVPTAKDNRAPKPDPISSGLDDAPRRQVGGVSDNMQMPADEVPF